MKSDLWRSNQQAFTQPGAAEWYATQNLWPAEAIVLLKYRDAFLGRRVLDLGVGSGRTTRYLLPFAGRYGAIDRSPAMLQRLREDFPGADAQDGDVRTIANFPGESFDFVIASCALLDALTHEDRLRALAAIRARMAPGALFYFSAHNRDGVKASNGPELPRLNWRNPPATARQLARHVISRANVRRLRHLRVDTREYGLLSDMGHNWSLVLYHMSAPAQLGQITAAGFELVDAFTDSGEAVDPSQPETQSPMLHYVVRTSA